MAQELLLVNPRRRKRRRKRTTKRRRTYRKNPVSNPRRRVRRRTRPVGSKFMQMMTPAVQGAFGAWLLDLGMGFLPMPETFKAQLAATPIMKHVVKGAGAVGLGMLLNQFVKGKAASNMAVGAMTVAFHGALKEFTAQALPQIGLGAYEQLAYYSPGPIAYEENSVGAYVEGEEMGAYVY